MFSMMIAQSVPANNTWKMWVDHIVKQREKLGLNKACMVQHNGAIASTSSSGFHPSAKEIQAINKMFLEKLNNNISSDKISIKEKTYVVKSLSSTQIIAFNGSKYIIVNRSKTKHVIALCDRKALYKDAALWLTKLSQKLVEKDF